MMGIEPGGQKDREQISNNFSRQPELKIFR
jgi:hypothetical protein